MQQKLSLRVVSSRIGHEIPRFLQDPTVHISLHEGPSTAPILSRTKPIQIFTNIFLRSMFILSSSLCLHITRIIFQLQICTNFSLDPSLIFSINMIISENYEIIMFLFSLHHYIIRTSSFIGAFYIT
jgi:hypothetical protein